MKEDIQELGLQRDIYTCIRHGHGCWCCALGELSPACLTNKGLVLTWESFSEHVLLDLMVHNVLLAKRGKNAPNLLGHRQTGEHSTNPVLHLPEEGFGSESKTVGTTRLLSVKQGARSPHGEHILLFLLG